MRRTPLLAVSAAVAVFGVTACGSSSNTQKLAQDVSGGKAAAGQSLFEQKNLDKALGAVKGKVGAGAKVSTLKIEPKSVKATVVSGGQPKILAGNLDGTVLTINVPTDLGNDFGSVDLGTVDTAAPAKMIAELKAQGATEDTVDYMVLSGDPISKKLKWEVFLTNGKGPFQANLDGSGAKALGSGSTTVVTSGSGSSSSSSGSSSAGGSVPSSSKVTDCIAKAGTDATKIAACATGG